MRNSVRLKHQAPRLVTIEALSVSIASRYLEAPTSLSAMVYRTNYSNAKIGRSTGYLPKPDTTGGEVCRGLPVLAHIATTLSTVNSSSENIRFPRVFINMSTS